MGLDLGWRERTLTGWTSLEAARTVRAAKDPLVTPKVRALAAVTGAGATREGHTAGERVGGTFRTHRFHVSPPPPSLPLTPIQLVPQPRALSSPPSPFLLPIALPAVSSALQPEEDDEGEDPLANLAAAAAAAATVSPTGSTGTQAEEQVEEQVAEEAADKGDEGIVVGIYGAEGKKRRWVIMDREPGDSDLLRLRVMHPSEGEKACPVGLLDERSRRVTSWRLSQDKPLTSSTRGRLQVIPATSPGQDGKVDQDVAVVVKPGHARKTFVVLDRESADRLKERVVVKGNANTDKMHSGQCYLLLNAVDRQRFTPTSRQYLPRAVLLNHWRACQSMNDTVVYLKDNLIGVGALNTMIALPILQRLLAPVPLLAAPCATSPISEVKGLVKFGEISLTSKLSQLIPSTYRCTRHCLSRSRGSTGGGGMAGKHARDCDGHVPRGPRSSSTPAAKRQRVDAEAPLKEKFINEIMGGMKSIEGISVEGQRQLIELLKSAGANV